MRLLTDLVPLRKTTDWESFRDPKPIPHRYGLCSGELLQYDQARLVFVWADHPSESIDKVYVNNTEVTNWVWSNATDSTGKAVTFVTFNAPPDQTATIYAAGKGKFSSRDGSRITNPADVVWDLLVNICELDTPYALLIQFKNTCARLNMEVGGSIDDSSMSIQSTVRSIAESVGAVFCPDSVSFLQVFPGAVPGAVRENLDIRFDLTANTRVDSISNDLTINFDFLNGKAQQSIEMQAPGSVAQFGKKPQVIDAYWLKNLRNAFDVAQRYLQHYARTTWQVQVAGIRKPLVVGDYVKLNHPVFHIEDPQMILGRERDLSTDLTSVTLSVPSGPVPEIKLLKSSTAFTPLQFASLDLQTVGGNRQLTLQNEDGSPIVNAAVTLDNDITHYTDAGGVVTFSVSSMPPGNHLISVVCQDGRRFSLTVLVT